MLIRELMSPNVAIVAPDMSLRQAAIAMAEKAAQGAAVVDDGGRIIGWVKQSQLIDAMAADDFDGAGRRRVNEVMLSDMLILRTNMNVKELQNFDFYKYDLFPVADAANRPVGTLRQNDLVRFLTENALLITGKMRAVLNSVYNGVIAVNEEGKINIFNDAAESITGLSRKEVMWHSIDEIIPNTGLKRVLETGQPELNKPFFIGNCKIVTNRSPILKGSKIVGAVAIFQDITELQTVAAELENVKSLKSTLESAIASLFEGIVIVDKNGYITMMNQSYGEFLGIDARQAIGLHVADVIPNTRMHVVAQGGKAEVMEIQKIKENNSVVTRIPIIKDGEVVGAVGKVLFKDLKDLKMVASNMSKLQSELEYYREELRKLYTGKYTVEQIVGNSSAINYLKSIALKAAKGQSTVLILGESGTGKEVFAQAIHNASPRSSGPFIKINCAAVPENLLESELFGYDEGAFTGAKKGGKPGKFELANGGTIFLDEIGDMPVAMQAKLLRVLQEREIERVGGTKSLKINVRVIAATNRDLENMIEQGQFRQDLYYRLNIIPIHIPPLRERREDIPALCQFLLHKISEQAPNQAEGVSDDAMEYILNYDWPGNVRELENVLERAVNLMDEDEQMIIPEHLPQICKKSRKKQTLGIGVANLSDMVDNAEKQAICQALEAAGGNKSKAAKLLGIHRSGFYQKLQKYNIG
ncbi:fis bacterial regulatory protein hth signature [Lucifera butyrica]|uniref:Fis bacterial regulatory protein hth signature n=1 Tax=Lucifera butyrica TaxID=1351585 RepID=A0A498R5G5_9FIRM|nr:sigma 54-interacting transcriptional regulator [Lucifera butyrica]VBB06694.1 fis bacterial regulatory protein hth signature [Lucifera butyrica]